MSQFHSAARAHDYGKQDPAVLFEKIRSDGFEGIQLAFKKAIWGVEDFSDITPELVENVRICCAKAGLAIPVLGVYIEPSYVEETLRQQSVQEFCSSFPIAKALQAGCIGTETTSMAKQPCVSRTDAIKSLLKSLSEILPLAEEQNVDVAIEPVFYHTMNTPELTKTVLNTMRSPRLKVIFDPVNLLSPDELSYQESLWERCFSCFGESIAAVHIKGIKQDASGVLQKASLQESIVNYKAVFDGLRTLNRNLFVMREEINPACAKRDILFIKNLF
ncbi:MAG TPA: sugar phosphate isomerase/epimerase family protein [Oscillospiraceae bacterium]|nr:sugar phosphate isomerase/epimerase family protein [Oscillospiraceae bacterium]